MSLFIFKEMTILKKMPPRLTGNVNVSSVLITGSHAITSVMGKECILLAALEL